MAETFYFVGPDEEPDKWRLKRLVGGEAELWEAAQRCRRVGTVAVKILRPDAFGDSADQWRASGRSRLKCSISSASRASSGCASTSMAAATWPSPPAAHLHRHVSAHSGPLVRRVRHPILTSPDEKA